MRRTIATARLAARVTFFGHGFPHHDSVKNQRIRGHHPQPHSGVLTRCDVAIALIFGLTPFKKKMRTRFTRCESGSLQCDLKSNAKIMKMWYKTCSDHTTKQVHLGVIMQKCSTYDLSVLGDSARHGRLSILAYSSCTGTVDVTSHLAGVTQGIWCDPQRMV
jgi:hypothetical protein